MIAGRTEHRILLAAPSGELHIVALKMAADLLVGAGYDARFMGGAVPAPALAAAVSRHAADVVCLSATMPGRSDQVLITIDEIHVCERVGDVVDATVQRPDRN